MITIVNKQLFKSSQRFYLGNEALHEAGVAEFGGLWLGANANVVDIARSWGFDPSTPEARQFFALLVLRVMRAAHPKRKKTTNPACSNQR